MAMPMAMAAQAPHDGVAMARPWEAAMGGTHGSADGDEAVAMDGLNADG